MKKIIQYFKAHPFTIVVFWLAFIVLNILFLNEIVSVIGIYSCFYYPSLIAILAVLLYKWDCRMVDTYDDAID